MNLFPYILTIGYLTIFKVKCYSNVIAFFSYSEGNNLVLDHAKLDLHVAQETLQTILQYARSIHYQIVFVTIQPVLALLSATSYIITTLMNESQSDAQKKDLQNQAGNLDNIMVSLVANIMTWLCDSILLNRLVIKGTNADLNDCYELEVRSRRLSIKHIFLIQISLL